MYKEDLALNNLQLLICHKTQSNKSLGAALFWPYAKLRKFSK